MVCSYLFWELNNQYCTSTGVAPGGGVWPPSDGYKTNRELKHFAPGVRVVPPGDTCGNTNIRGAWRLTARVPRQAVWKPYASGDSCAMPGNFLWSRRCVLLALDVRGLRGFGRYLKGQMLEYSWSCGSG